MLQNENISSKYFFTPASGLLTRWRNFFPAISAMKMLVKLSAILYLLLFRVSVCFVFVLLFFDPLGYVLAFL